MIISSDKNRTANGIEWRQCTIIITRMGCLLLFFLPLALGGLFFRNCDYNPGPPFFEQPRKERILAGFSGSIAFDPNGDFLLTQGGGNDLDPAVIFHLPSRHDPRLPGVRWVNGHTAYRKMAWSPNGIWLAYGWGCAKYEAPYPDMLMLLDSKTGEVVHRLVGQGGGYIGNVVFSMDSRFLASSSSNNTVCLWDVASGELIHKLIGDGHPDLYMNDVAFSPDGQFVASINTDHAIRLWEVSTGRFVRKINQNCSGPGAPARLAFHPTKAHLLAATDTYYSNGDLPFFRINIWDFRLPDKVFKVASFIKHTKGISCIAFHKDGRYLASGSFDGWVYLWDVVKKELVYSLDNRGEIGKIVFSADGNRLAVSAGSGHFAVTTIWDLHPAEKEAPPR